MKEEENSTTILDPGSRFELGEWSVTNYGKT